MSIKVKNSGYSLVEMIIYVAILSAISAIVVNMLLSLTGSYRTISALRIAEHSGIDSMERMTRDIRGATSVDTGNSTLNSSPGVLTLISTINFVSTTTKFYVQNGVLKVDINGSYFGPLTLSNTLVTNLVFRLLNSGTSNAVKIDLTVQGTVGATTKTKTYHSTVILRGEGS